MRFERWWYTIPLRCRSLFKRRDVERDLDDELQDHLQEMIDRGIAAGLTRDDAERRARARFGPVDLTKERCRDQRRTAVFDTIVRDARYALRTLVRDPGFTAAAIVTLSLAIGATTAVFSLVDGILLARLPYRSPSALVSVTGTYPGGAFAAMRDQLRSLDVAVHQDGVPLTLAGGGDPVRVRGARISAELLSLLGVDPALGRTLAPGEDVAPRDRVVVLSHALWVSRFAADASVIGRSILIDGSPREVVGVMPPHFAFPSATTELWIPLGLDPRNAVGYWAGAFMPVVGRLRPDASLDEARAEVRLFQRRIPAQFPWTMPADWNRDVTVEPLQDAIVSGVRARLLILLAGVALVLAIACANVANLALSRAASRDREIALRTALGASPARIAGQMLTESVLLAGAGGLAGLVVATQALDLLTLVLPADTPRLHDVAINGRVLAVMAAVTLTTGCACGIAPAARARRAGLQAALASGGRGGGRVVSGAVRAALTTAQVACAVWLSIAAGLLVRNLHALSAIDPGFARDGIVTARLSPPEPVCGTVEGCLAFYTAFVARTQQTAGIDAAALVNTVPLTGAVEKRSLELEGYTVPPAETAPLFWLTIVSADYFRVMTIPIQSGRAFTAEDAHSRAGVAIVSAASARRFWPHDNPIGKHVRFVGERDVRTIVGVAADVRAFDLTRSVPEYMAGTIYVPFGATATREDGRLPSDMSVVMRTSLDPHDATARLRELAAGLRRDVVVGDAAELHAVVSAAVAAPAATTSLLVGMAAIAVTLGCIGVYGVLSFLVSRQARDVAIRLALGSSRRAVLWLVIRQGAPLCVAGLGLGIAAAAVTGRWLASELHGISAWDPSTYAAVAAMMVVVTLLACYVPTRRAMRVDPLTVLRD